MTGEWLDGVGSGEGAACGLRGRLIIAPSAPFRPSRHTTPDAHASNIKRTLESLYVSTLKGLRAVGVPTTSLAVDADDVGAAIAQLAIHPPPEGLTELYNDDMIKLANEFRAAQNKARHA